MRAQLIILFILALFFSGCAMRSDTDPFSVIHPESSKAHLLALTEEDLLYLNYHNPSLLEKIDRCEKLSLDDIINLYILGLSSETMILILDYTSSHFTLSTSDVLKLQTEGVPFKVINHMIRS